MSARTEAALRATRGRRLADVPKGAPFRLHGAPIPRSTARGADDGTTVFESETGRPVTRWRTETAKRVPPMPAAVTA